MKNYYSDVIAELEKPLNWRAIVFAAAKIAPSAVLRAMKEVGAKSEPGFIGQCRALVHSGEKIQAIKLWRSETGSSLVDAKKAVESL